MIKKSSNMTGKPKYMLILFLAIIIADASAQNSQVLYYMNLPQNHLLNPAMRPSNSVYIGLPMISGININMNNNFVNFSDVFMKSKTSDSIITFLHPDNNIDDFLAKIKDKNSIELEGAVQLFGLGFSTRKGTYIFLDLNERTDENVVIPGDLFKLAFKGNEGFVGSKIDLSSLRGDMNYYHEAGLGFSRNFTNKLRVGVKAKVLFGLTGASINNKSLGIIVNDDYSHSLDADLTFNVSGPVQVYMSPDNKIDSISFDDERFNTTSGIIDFFTNTKNLGLAIDIGATYEISDRIMVSAAVTDLGYIRWKSDVTNLHISDQFEFSGLDMLDVVNGTKTFDDVAQEMLDSLKNSLVISKSNSAYNTYLPMGVTLGGSYNLTEHISLGLLSYSRFIGKQIRESLTLSANVNLGNAFSTSVSYTVANHRFDNLGAGIAFRAGIFQFYLLADRIPVTWNNIKSDNNTIPLPAVWNSANLRLGMNLAFGNRIRKKDDKPMLMVQ
jgi:hypothetical protein